MRKIPLIVALLAVMVLSASASFAQEPAMTFFLTSSGSGNGANLGGLEGADARCQLLGRSVGRGDATWRAYLSTQGDDAVNARDRIGTGPWHNANGVMVAANVAELHGENNLTAETQVNENGARISGRGMTPNRHDVITGSMSDGTAFEAGPDRTCGNWTSEGSNGSDTRRPLRPRGRRRRWIVLERGAQFERLQPGGAAGNGRRRPLLLLRRKLARLGASGRSRASTGHQEKQEGRPKASPPVPAHPPGGLRLMAQHSGRHPSSEQRPCRCFSQRKHHSLYGCAVRNVAGITNPARYTFVTYGVRARFLITSVVDLDLLSV